MNAFRLLVLDELTTLNNLNLDAEDFYSVFFSFAGGGRTSDINILTFLIPQVKGLHIVLIFSREIVDADNVLSFPF